MDHSTRATVLMAVPTSSISCSRRIYLRMSEVRMSAVRSAKGQSHRVKKIGQ